MAQFCTKCGTPLTEGMKFCTGCGATFGEPSAPAAPPPPLQPAVTPPAPRPVVAGPAAAAPTASPGSPVLKIILIVVAVLIFLGLLSAGACVYMVYRAKQKVNQFEKQVHATFPMPAGTREVRTEPSAPAAVPVPTPPAGPVVDTGVPVYPGAAPWGGGGQMSLGGNTVKTQQYTTDDSVEKVVAFYKDKMGPTARVMESGGQGVVQVFGTSGVTTIGIATDSSLGKTKISISNMTK